MDLGGKTAVVTGAGGGIGAALAAAFAGAGARVVVNDIDEEAAARTASTIGGAAVAADVGTPEGNRALIEAARAELGAEIDVLACNAGVPGPGGVDASDPEWDLAWRVNVMAHVWAVREVLPAWVARGDGCLVTTVSAAGLLTNLGTAPYATTKHAALGLSEWLAITHADDGVRVHAICPLFVRTGMLEDFQGVPGGELLIGETTIEPAQVASATLAAMAEGRFLVLPHPEVADYVVAQATDRPRWQAAMRRLWAAMRAASD